MDKIMQNSIYELCDRRGVFIPCSVEDEFEQECEKLDIHPCGGIWFAANDPNTPIPNTECRNFHLDKAITLAEAKVIADHHGLLGEFEYEISKGATPFEALAEWDLI